jgi:DNA-binding response OmpR family regulator
MVNNALFTGTLERPVQSPAAPSYAVAHERRHQERRHANERRLEGASVAHSQQAVRIDQRNKCVYLRGKKVDLTRKEFELFELLASDPDRIFMAEEIINHVWPDNNRATKSDLYQYMHLLRKKIEKDPNNPQFIATVKGFGYKLSGV